MSWPGPGLVVGFTALVTFFLRSSIRHKNRLRAHGLRTWGTVTGHETSSDAEGGITYCLLVQFTARNGRRYAWPSAWHRAPPPQAVGEEVALVYEASNPYVVELEAGLSQTKNYFLLCSCGSGPRTTYGPLEGLAAAGRPLMPHYGCNYAATSCFLPALEIALPSITSP